MLSDRTKWEKREGERKNRLTVTFEIKLSTFLSTYATLVDWKPIDREIILLNSIEWKLLFLFFGGDVRDRFLCCY